MLKVKITDTAKNQLVEIGEYTEQKWGALQKKAYLERIKENIYILSEDPERGRKRNEVKTNISSFAVGRHVIFYIYDNERIQIMAILHERMDFESHL